MLIYAAAPADRLDELPLPVADPPTLAEALAELVAVLPEPSRSMLSAGRPRRGGRAPSRWPCWDLAHESDEQFRRTGKGNNQSDQLLNMHLGNVPPPMALPKR